MSFITTPIKFFPSIGIGSNSLEAGAARWGNIAIGDSAIESGTIAQTNVAIGYSVMQNITTGTGNVSVGSFSSRDTGPENYNVALGTFALRFRNGSNNTAIGAFSLASQNASGTSNRNTAIGFKSGQFIDTGEKNTIVGCYDGTNGGLDITNSSGNIVLSDGDGNPRIWVDSNGNSFLFAQTTPPTLSINRQMVFNLTSDTNLRISVRGTDGVTRVANILLV
jgi:hypothetical protein